MQYLIVEFEADKDYIKHFQLMLKTKLGFEPVMSSHPSSGDRPKMFDTEEQAQNFYREIKNDDFQEYCWFNQDNKKIVFFPRSSDYVAHFEIWEKKLFKWKPIMSFHPMSGDRPLMLHTFSEAKDYISSDSQESQPRRFKF